MSHDATTWVFHHSPLRGMERFVHLAIADAANRENDYLVTVKQTTVAANTTASRRTVSTVYRKLEDLGLLVRLDDAETDRARRSAHQAIRYRLMLPTDVQSPRIETSGSNLSVGQPMCSGRASDVQPATDRCATSDKTDVQSPRILGTENQNGCRTEVNGTPPRRGSAPVLQLFTESSVEPAVPAGPRAVAKLILDDWWELQQPKPQQKYIAILKVMERALESGWEERDLREALDSVPTMSGPALDFWRNRRNGTKRPQYGTGSKPAAQLAEESMSRLSKLMGYS